jgi:NAD(P)-dependent dehydrogenase (short-subunit alcohol dehydrogenase family)
MNIPELTPRPGAFARYPSLADRTVFVTGGGSGIGAAIVTAFAGQGAKVAFVDIDVASSEALVGALARERHEPLFIHCDLTDVVALRAAVADVRAKCGPVAALVNNAANDTRQPIAEVTPESWDQAMDVNLRHQFFAAQAVHSHMKELGYGAIVNFSSVAWIFGGADFIAYSSAKAAVVGLTNGLARAFGPDNIRVNAIAPGAVHTPRQLKLWYTREQAGEMTKAQFLKQWLLPDELARAAVFLAADDSRMITKQCLVVDAGLR